MNSFKQFDIDKFLSDNGSDKLVDKWNTQENIKSFKVVVRESSAVVTSSRIRTNPIGTSQPTSSVPRSDFVTSLLRVYDIEYI